MTRRQEMIEALSTEAGVGAQRQARTRQLRKLPNSILERLMKTHEQEAAAAEEQQRGR